jgi:biotin/methionine sulfoxide reductase
MRSFGMQPPKVRPAQTIMAAISGYLQMPKRVLSMAHWGAFYAVVDDGRVIGCEPFEHDPAPSPLLASMPAAVHSELRVRAPAIREGWLKRRDRERRAGERYIEVGWDEALSLAAGELARIRQAHGARALFGGSYGWSSAGRVHHARTLVRRFLFSGGGCVDQLGNYSWGAAQFLLPHVIGTYEPVSGKVTEWRSVARHTRLFVAFGGLPAKNAQVGSGGVGQHGTEHWLREARVNGCRFVMVSPLRDAPEWLEAEWIPIRPNTDSALMLSLLHELVAGGRHDRAFLTTHCQGWERLEAYIADKTPEWAEAITGVSAATTRRLARAMSEARTLLSAAWSLQRAHRGEQPYWALIALAAALGQIGLPGGGFGFGHGSIHGAGEPRPDVPAPAMPTGHNPAKSAIPVARFADMLLAPGEDYEFNGRRAAWPDIRLVYWAGGNPFHHHQDLSRLERAWSRPETVIVHDAWWTASARRADIVLPATTTFEREDIGAGARDRWIVAMKRAIAPQGLARDDFAIFRELAARLGYEARFTEGRDPRGWIEWIYARTRDACAAGGIPLAEFDAFWERGWVELPLPEREFVLFEDFRRDPARHPLATPSGKIELYSERIASFGYEDCPPHPSWLAPAEWLGDPQAGRYPLHLVTVQPPDRLHGQLDPGPVSRQRKVAGREAVRLNPGDAAERHIFSGDIVEIESGRGRCLAGAVLDEAVMPGVAIMATGAWFDPDAAGMDRHGNPNVLAFDRGTSRLTQGPSPLSLLVEIRRHAGSAPRVRAHEPPQLAPSHG